MVFDSDKVMRGYIEGYYGKILKWSERKKIIIKLASCKMNTYLYAPKEDVNHRLNWKRKYNKRWLSNFKNFCSFANQKNVRILAGIAPGLSFNYNYITIGANHNDFETLKNKALSLLNLGASNIVLLLDDIPDHFESKNKLSEGFLHAKLANDLSKSIKKNIYFVPRIYSNEQIIEKPSYLKDLAKNINPLIKLFYCGEDMVSKSILRSDLASISSNFRNKIIFWDNLYANDYCPRKLFVGKWKNRDHDLNILINPTGMINTDLFILDIVAISKDEKNYIYNHEMTLKKHNIPKQFQLIQHYFNIPHFNSSTGIILKTEPNKNIIDALDYLLWKWKSKLSLEWYPFLMILKQDINIQLNEYNNSRIIKIQTIPLAKMLTKKN